MSSARWVKESLEINHFPAMRDCGVADSTIRGEGKISSPQKGCRRQLQIRPHPVDLPDEAIVQPHMHSNVMGISYPPAHPHKYPTGRYRQRRAPPGAFPPRTPGVPAPAAKPVPEPRGIALWCHNPIRHSVVTRHAEVLQLRCRDQPKKDTVPQMRGKG